MGIHFLLQAVLTLFLFSAAFRAEAGERAAVPLSPRQAEILGQLLSFRPAGMPAEGEWMLSAWDADAGWEAFCPPPTGPGNAAQSFRALEEAYPAEKDLLEKGDGDIRGVDLLLEAAAASECRLSPENYPEFDKVTARQPDFLVLRLYLQALLDRAARAEKSGDVGGAERCYVAAIQCGRHLVADKSSAVVYMTGLIFKLRGGQAYESFLRRRGRAEEADTVKQCLAALGEILRAFNWKANAALGSMEDFAALPVAIRVATRDREACWRKEAVLRLALFRFGALRQGTRILDRNPAFERTAEAALVRIAATDPDPSVRRFTVWAALNVKPELYEELEHRF